MQVNLPFFNIQHEILKKKKYKKKVARKRLVAVRVGQTRISFD